MLRWIACRAGFLMLFTIGFCVMSFAALMLALSAGLGPPRAGDPPVTATQEWMSSLGHAMLTVMWFPMDTVKAAYFAGQPLPSPFWLWIAGCGALYGIVIVMIYDFVRWPLQRRESGETTPTAPPDSR